MLQVADLVSGIKLDKIKGNALEMVVVMKSWSTQVDYTALKVS